MAISAISSSPLLCLAVGSPAAIYPIPDLSLSFDVVRSFFFNQTQKGLTLKNVELIPHLDLRSLWETLHKWTYPMGYSDHSDFIQSQIQSRFCINGGFHPMEEGVCKKEGGEPTDNCDANRLSTYPTTTPEERYLLRVLHKTIRPHLENATSLCKTISVVDCAGNDCRAGCGTLKERCSCMASGLNSYLQRVSNTVGQLSPLEVEHINCGRRDFNVSLIESLFIRRSRKGAHLGLINTVYLKYWGLEELYNIALSIRSIVKDRGFWTNLAFSLGDRDYFKELFGAMKQEYESRPVKCEFSSCSPNSHEDLPLHARPSACFPESIPDLDTLTSSETIPPSFSISREVSSSCSLSAFPSDSEEASISFSLTPPPATTLPPATEEPGPCCARSQYDCVHKCHYHVTDCRLIGNYPPYGAGHTSYGCCPDDPQKYNC